MKKISHILLYIAVIGIAVSQITTIKVVNSLIERDKESEVTALERYRKHFYDKCIEAGGDYTTTFGELTACYKTVEDEIIEIK